MEERSWPNLRHYCGICLKGLRKITKIFIQDRQWPGQFSNRAPSRYSAVALPLEVARSLENVSVVFKCHLAYSDKLLFTFSFIFNMLLT
jgi:hypothetical protein